MVHEKQAEISIDDFYPRNDGFVQTYKGEWRERGMIATAWLAPVERDHFPRGLFLPGAYELSSTYERIQGGPARGARQEELGAALARKLRERMKTEMRAAGWQVVTQTREGRDIWQYKPKPARLSSAQNVTTTQVTVTRTARNVSWPVSSFLTIGYNRFFSHGLWSGIKTNSMWREKAFSSPLLTQPTERIQNTCCILWIKNY